MADGEIQIPLMPILPPQRDGSRFHGNTERETALRGRSRCNYDWSQGDVWAEERRCLNLWLHCGQAPRWEQRGGSRSCWVTLTIWLFACCSFRFCSSSVAHITAVQLCSAMLRVCFSAPDISPQKECSLLKLLALPVLDFNPVFLPLFCQFPFDISTKYKDWQLEKGKTRWRLCWQWLASGSVASI